MNKGKAADLINTTTKCIVINKALLFESNSNSRFKRMKAIQVIKLTRSKQNDHILGPQEEEAISIEDSINY